MLQYLQLLLPVIHTSLLVAVKVGRSNFLSGFRDNTVNKDLVLRIEKICFLLNTLLGAL